MTPEMAALRKCLVDRGVLVPEEQEQVVEEMVKPKAWLVIKRGSGPNELVILWPGSPKAEQTKNTEAERNAAEIRLRAERKAGELIIEVKQDGQRDKGHYRKLDLSEVSQAPKLEDLGISHKQTSKWQQLGAVLHHQFESALRDPTTKPSTNGIIRDSKPKPQPEPKPLRPRVDREQVLQLRAAGMSYRAIAQHFGICVASTWWIVHPRGAPGVAEKVLPETMPFEPPPKPAEKSKHDEYTARVAELVRWGKSYDEALDLVLEAPDASATR